MLTHKYGMFTGKHGMFTGKHGMFTGKYLHPLSQSSFFNFHRNELICCSLLLYH